MDQKCHYYKKWALLSNFDKQLNLNNQRNNKRTKYVIYIFKLGRNIPYMLIGPESPICMFKWA